MGGAGGEVGGVEEFVSEVWRNWGTSRIAGCWNEFDD